MEAALLHATEVYRGHGGSVGTLEGDVVSVGYGRPTLTPGCHLWATDCQIGRCLQPVVRITDCLLGFE